MPADRGKIGTPEERVLVEGPNPPHRLEKRSPGVQKKFTGSAYSDGIDLL